MDVSSQHSIAELQDLQKQTNDAYLLRNLRIIILAQLPQQFSKIRLAEMFSIIFPT